MPLMMLRFFFFSLSMPLFAIDAVLMFTLLSIHDAFRRAAFRFID